MNTAIEFRNVKKSYGDKTVIENLNLTVEQGEFVTIVGSSGCGKTTALKIINGLIDATDGGYTDRRREYQEQRSY